MLTSKLQKHDGTVSSLYCRAQVGNLDLLQLGIHFEVLRSVQITEQSLGGYSWLHSAPFSSVETWS